ncbi:uncharacterized protein LOC121404110 [Drosophila obscura]|uniref:uncharacterized protein LOC121404110 n=1 Tax=Drosophila obscura TaxID=7282 RepID=UPI001BB2B7ED|nr:uncharacterized protein LOC121404110 [Drosophila obscura]
MERKGIYDSIWESFKFSKFIMPEMKSTKFFNCHVTMAAFKSFSLIVLIVLACAVAGVSCKFEFTNLKCTTLEQEFVEFDRCFLKSVNRTYKYLTVSTKIHVLPLNSASIQTQVLKRLNGYKPFLFNFTTDACMVFGGKMNPTTRFFFGLMAPYSNMNHSCPYDHDIIVEKLPISFLNEQLTRVLPFPEGDYCVKNVYSFGGKPRAQTEVHVHIS